MRQSIRLEINSEALNVDLVGVAIRALCFTVGIPAVDAARVELGVVEAVNNVIRHGYAHRADGQIAIAWNREPGNIRIEIRDQGEPLPHWRPRPSFPDPFEESGRGWPLIAACFDQVDYCAQNTGNTLTLTKVIR